LFGRGWYEIVSASPTTPNAFGDRLVTMLRKRMLVFTAPHSSRALAGDAIYDRIASVVVDLLLSL
jgi:hypothetical protein